MENNENHIMEPPRFDMLSIKFRGDLHELVVPYCEVANGVITQLENDKVEIVMVTSNKTERVNMSYREFLQVIEQTFDIKEVIKLSVQLAGSFEQIQIL